MKTKMKTYKMVNYQDVQVKFVCDECAVEVWVFPEEMAQVGSPICDTCDCEMEFHSVEVSTSILA